MRGPRSTSWLLTSSPLTCLLVTLPSLSMAATALSKLADGMRRGRCAVGLSPLDAAESDTKPPLTVATPDTSSKACDKAPWSRFNAIVPLRTILGASAGTADWATPAVWVAPATGAAAASLVRLGTAKEAPLLFFDPPPEQAATPSITATAAAVTTSLVRI